VILFFVILHPTEHIVMAALVQAFGHCSFSAIVAVRKQGLSPALTNKPNHFPI